MKLSHRFRAWLVILARSGPVGFLVRWVLGYMSFVIPVQRLRETASLLAFFHPSPGYPFHILILPKRAYRSLLDLSPGDGDFLRDLVQTVQSLVQEFSLEQQGYRLVANGGAYQEAPVLHFHLISERRLPEGQQG